MIRKLIQAVFANLKNSLGWKTNKKIVVFSVDDYGNVRLHSKAARITMDKAGLPIYSRFDALDTLETTQDLEKLYEVLDSVKDKNGRNAVFTAFVLPCNINFEKVKQSNFQDFHNETLPETFAKLAKETPKSYNGAWEKWQEGMQKGFLKPQFHGREHLNLSIFNEKLKNKDKQLLVALQNESYASISDANYPTMSCYAPFDFWDSNDNENFKSNIIDGLQKFESVFGFRSTYFTPPVFNIHHSLFAILKEQGIRFIDLALYRKEHQGFNVYKKSFNFSGKKTKEGLTIMVRNVVFEPTEDRGIDWIAFTMKQIETAFRWNKPAIISSHRVNFCGHIEEANREKGLQSLQLLLESIVKKWPDVEFMSADELGECLANKSK